MDTDGQAHTQLLAVYTDYAQVRNFSLVLFSPIHNFQGLMLFSYVMPSTVVYIRVLVMSYRRRNETFYFHISLSQVSMLFS